LFCLFPVFHPLCIYGNWTGEWLLNTEWFQIIVGVSVYTPWKEAALQHTGTKRLAGAVRIRGSAFHSPILVTYFGRKKPAYEITILSVYVCLWIPLYQLLNAWNIFKKLCMYIMAPEPVSTAYVCLMCIPLSLLGNASVKKVTARTNTHATKKRIDGRIIFSAVRVVTNKSRRLVLLRTSGCFMLNENIFPLAFFPHHNW
jgi:hypothetical protein